MGTTFACIKGKMGSTDYYLIKMKAGILVNTVGFASQIAEWDDMDIDEKIQRELNETRVVQEIVPYLINDKDRFFGSLIVDVYQGWEDLAYEPLSDLVKVPKAYQNQVDEFGFITIPDNQSLIALDGQHRLLALSVAIKGFRGLSGTVKLSDEIMAKLKPHPELTNEDITVILVPHTDTVTIRKIFNKINRYAKSTSRGDNIITDEDDIYALISRRLMKAGEPLQPINGQHLVNWTSNSLSKRSKHLTTISAIYSFTEEILEKKFDKKVRPEESIIEEKYEEVEDIWKTLMGCVDDFQEYVNIVEGSSDKDVTQLREESLLLKPVTQMAVAIGYKLSQRKGISLTNFVEGLNHINWRFNAPIWEQILVIPSTKKVITNKQAINNAGRLISYLVAGDKYSSVETQDLLDSIKLTNPKYVLPNPVFMIHEMKN